MALVLSSDMPAHPPEKVVQDLLSDDEDDDFDFDEEYFMRTYKPLSNLPTPPPSSKNSSAALSPMLDMEEGAALDPVYLGAAVHLVNLLPPAASLASPSISLVHTILGRAELPLHTVALAVCIMDSLDSKFARAWRTSCPLAQLGPDSDFDEAEPDYTHITTTTTASAGQQRQPLRTQHIDSIPSELVILAALVIASKFTEDSQEPTRWYAAAWGNWLWTCEQINTTERCIMENLGYRIMPLTAPDILEDALTDMARAAKSVRGYSCCGNSSSLSSSSLCRGGYVTPVTPAASD